MNEQIPYFQSKTETIRKKLLDILDNKVTVGIGQAAKATVMCNYFGLDKYIKVIHDTTPEKIDKFQPGTGIKIFDYKFSNYSYSSNTHALIFPYNWEQECITKIKASSPCRIDKFISWMPEVKVING